MLLQRRVFRKKFKRNVVVVAVACEATILVVAAAVPCALALVGPWPWLDPRHINWMDRHEPRRT